MVPAVTSASCWHLSLSAVAFSNLAVSLARFSLSCYSGKNKRFVSNSSPSYLSASEMGLVCRWFLRKLLLKKAVRDWEGLGRGGEKGKLGVILHRVPVGTSAISCRKRVEWKSRAVLTQVRELRFPTPAPQSLVRAKKGNEHRGGCILSVFLRVWWKMGSSSLPKRCRCCF